jgi:hypothetical protein
MISNIMNFVQDKYLEINIEVMNTQYSSSRIVFDKRCIAKIIISDYQFQHAVGIQSLLINNSLANLSPSY